MTKNIKQSKLQSTYGYAQNVKHQTHQYLFLKTTSVDTANTFAAISYTYVPPIRKTTKPNNLVLVSMSIDSIRKGGEGQDIQVIGNPDNVAMQETKN